MTKLRTFLTYTVLFIFITGHLFSIDHLLRAYIIIDEILEDLELDKSDLSSVSGFWFLETFISKSLVFLSVKISSAISFMSLN